MSEFTKISTQEPITKPANVSAPPTRIHTRQAIWLTPGKLATQCLEQFVSTILTTSIHIQLDQPFGKGCLLATIALLSKIVLSHFVAASEKRFLVGSGSEITSY
jgi:hypothetical protein